MALIIDVGVNSYVTLDEFKTYAETQKHMDLTGITDADLNVLLVNATEIIDTKDFAGDRASDTQALKFPRINLPLIDGINYDNVIPIGVKKATYIIAYHLNTNDMNKIGVQNGTVQQVKVGPIDVKFAEEENENVATPYTTLPPLAQTYLNEFLSLTGSISHVFVSR